MKKHITNLYFPIFAAVFVLINVAFECAQTRVVDLTEDSNMEIMEPVKVAQVDEDTKEYYFEPEETGGMSTSLAFFLTNYNVTAYEDGTMVYSLRGDGTIWGSSPGLRWNFIEIMPGTKEIKVQLQAVYPSVRDAKVTFIKGSSLQIVLEIMRTCIVEIIVSILDFSIGLMLVGYWIAVSRKISIGRAPLYLGFFAMIIGMWSLHETEIMRVLLSNRVAASFGGYSLIMLMTVPFVLFIREILEVKEERISNLICITSYILIVASIVLHMTGICEFKYTSRIAHLLDCVALIYAIWALVCWIRKKGMDRVAKVNLLGAIVLAAAFVVDIRDFYAGVRRTDTFGRYGFLLYIVLLTWQVSSDVIFKINEGRRAAIYKELAEKDVLTKVYNRNAYNEWTDNNPKPQGTAVVTFDLNNLKQCNDTLGHAAGDEYIQRAAEFISKVFGAENKCYRIGGDEFCVTVSDARVEWIEQKFKELEVLEQEYNAVSKLVRIQIAHGYAVFDEKTDADIEKTRERADVRMYENKKARKAK